MGFTAGISFFDTRERAYEKNRGLFLAGENADAVAAGGGGGADDYALYPGAADGDRLAHPGEFDDDAVRVGGREAGKPAAAGGGPGRPAENHAGAGDFSDFWGVLFLDVCDQRRIADYFCAADDSAFPSGRQGALSAAGDFHGEHRRGARLPFNALRQPPESVSVWAAGDQRGAVYTAYAAAVRPVRRAAGGVCVFPVSQKRTRAGVSVPQRRGRNAPGGRRAGEFTGRCLRW